MADVRPIDANALEKRMAQCYKEMEAKNGPYDHYACGFDDAITYVEDAPTIDAMPVVHARWVHEQRYGDSGGWVWRCTACRREAITPIISALKYCHACGAKMDGGAEG